MKIVRYITIFLAVMFLGIVTIERFPGVMVPTSEPFESLMFGLFKISLLDDITHGISGVLGFLAFFLGYRWSVRYLMVIGGYYTLDALFFVVNGFATGQSVIDNFMLNVPHIGISLLVGYALVKSVRKIELHESPV